MAKHLIATLGLLFACGDDGEPGPVDVAPVSDAPSADADLAIDASTACTGATYDPCTEDMQCMSTMCQPFSSAGFTACTQACDASTPCPDQNGVAVPCNQRGICRPPMPNDCTR